MINLICYLVSIPMLPIAFTMMVLGPANKWILLALITFAAA